MRLKVRSSVVFPEPLSPTSATVSPGATASETPASAAVPSAYVLATSRASSI